MAKKENKVIKPELPQADLILFDRKTNITLAVLFGCYLLFSFLKMHTSSVAVWDQVFGTKKSKSVLAGSPRPIRQDEWMIGTSSVVTQFQTGFPLSNPTFGAGNVPVILGLPVKDITMIMRPHLWMYFVLDMERGFAFAWNFNIFIFLVSMFLLFMLLTGNKFWLSLGGTLLVFSSSAEQWWSYSLGSNMIYLNGIVISFLFLLYSNRILPLVVSGLILLFSSYNFLVTLYPPWQVPLVYVYIFLTIGYILQRRNFKSIPDKLLLKAGIFGLVILGLLLFGFHYYNLVKDTYAILLNTAYPGKRSTNGGDLISGKLFSAFYDMFMDDKKVPAAWLNICEASGFMMFFPIVFYLTGKEIYLTRKFNFPVLSLCAVVLFLLAWVLLGFPQWLSTASLMSMSPAYRTLPILGYANVLLLVVYLGSIKVTKDAPVPWLEAGVIAIITFLFITFTGSHINEATENFFTSEQLLTVTVCITMAYVLIRFYYLKLAPIILGVLLLGMNISQWKVNPLTSGLAPVTDNFLVKESKKIADKDPNGRWAVFGNPMLSNMLKINGINVFNGVKIVPMLDDMKVLDTAGKDNFIYNRYAHIQMASYIDFKDTMFFKLNENNVVNDNYTICIDPCSPRLSKLGINYFLFSYQPKPAEVRCMKPLYTNGLYIYKKE